MNKVKVFKPEATDLYQRHLRSVTKREGKGYVWLSWIFSRLPHFCQGKFCDRSHTLHYTVQTKKLNDAWKLKLLTFNLVAIETSSGLQKCWREYFLISFICLTKVFVQLFLFRVKKRKATISTQFKVELGVYVQDHFEPIFNQFRIGTFECSLWMRSEYKKVPALACFHHRFCAARRQNVEVQTPPWMYF